MRSVCKNMLVLGLALLLAGPALAQRGQGRGGFGGGFGGPDIESRDEPVRIHWRRAIT